VTLKSGQTSRRKVLEVRMTNANGMDARLDALAG
jgi:uncharacterized protein YggU (UPF0235/DUF167 family)